MMANNELSILIGVHAVSSTVSSILFPILCSVLHNDIVIIPCIPRGWEQRDSLFLWAI